MPVFLGGAMPVCIRRDHAASRAVLWLYCPGSASLVGVQAQRRTARPTSTRRSRRRALPTPHQKASAPPGRLKVERCACELLVPKPCIERQAPARLGGAQQRVYMLQTFSQGVVLKEVERPRSLARTSGVDDSARESVWGVGYNQVSLQRRKYLSTVSVVKRHPISLVVQTHRVSPSEARSFLDAVGM